MKQRDLYHSKYYRHGASYGVTIPPDIRELAGLVAGDQVVMNFDHGMIWIKKLDKSVVFDRTKVAAVFDKLFPDKEETNGRK
jgi:antitoxin component of MazEF toxin-antitoxin module